MPFSGMWRRVLPVCTVIPPNSETSVHTRSTRCHIPKNGILHSHRRENLKSYTASILIAVKRQHKLFMFSKNCWKLLTWAFKHASKHVNKFCNTFSSSSLDIDNYDSFLKALAVRVLFLCTVCSNCPRDDFVLKRLYSTMDLLIVCAVAHCLSSAVSWLKMGLNTLLTYLSELMLSWKTFSTH
jgi:hypothetical protein